MDVPSPLAFVLHDRSRPLPGSGSAMVLTLYAALVSGLGLFVFAWGVRWLTIFDLPGQPFGRAAILRAVGSVMLASGLCAAGFASVDDPWARLRGLLWFTAAHLAVFVAVLTQRIAIWSPGPADLVLWLLTAAIVILATAAYEYPLSAVVRALGGTSPSPAGRLHAAHERRIREAAGQEERNRLARDLHDSIKQQLFAIQTAAATVQARFESDATGAKQALDQVRAASRDAMTEMDALLDQLRAVPLANAGLVEALRKQCETLGFRTGAHVQFRLGALPPDRALAPGAQQAMLRVAQEALANVARHARASHVTVSLASVSGRLELAVQDDGAGFQPGQDRRGMGMENMAARAAEIGGSLAVTSYVRNAPADGAEAASPDASTGVPGARFVRAGVEAGRAAQAGRRSAPADPADGTLVRFSVPCFAEARARALTCATLCAVLLGGSILSLQYESNVSAAMAVAAAIGLGWSVLYHRQLRRDFGKAL